MVRAHAARGSYIYTLPHRFHPNQHGARPPTTLAPSIVPPLISAVAATKEVLAFSVVKVPAAGVAEPITALSIAPEFRSTDVIVVVPVADKLAKVARPVNADVPVVVSVGVIAVVVVVVYVVICIV